MSAPVLSPSAVARIFRIVAVAEACSWLGLLVGMAVKYVPPGGIGNEVGVAVFGPIHGGLFIAYVLLTLLTARLLRWSPRVVVLALVAGVPPLATLVFERWARRTGRLNDPARRVPDRPDVAAR